MAKVISLAHKLVDKEIEKQLNIFASNSKRKESKEDFANRKEFHSQVVGQYIEALIDFGYNDKTQSCCECKMCSSLIKDI